MRWGFLLVLLGALSLPAGASAVVFPGSPQPYQRWADAAHVPTVVGTVELVMASCPGREESACTAYGDSIYLNAPVFAALGFDPRPDLLHELGHHFDYAMPEQVRSRFAAVMGDTRPWRAPPNSPHEQFAEAYSLCALGGRAARRVGFGGYAYQPTVRQRRAVCSLIRRARFPGLRRSP